MTETSTVAPVSRTELVASRLPWAENMVEVPDGAKAEELLHAAGLDWSVEFGDVKREQRVYRHTELRMQDPYDSPRPFITEVTDPKEIKRLIEQDPDNLAVTTEWRVAKDVKDVRRVEDWKIFGQVGSSYNLVQNVEGFRFADHLVDDGAAQWIAAGEQYGGKIVFGVMRLTDAAITVGDESVIDNYLIVRTSHNGTTGVQIMVTPIMVQCENMMGIASRAAKAKWSFRHVGTLEGQIANARNALTLAHKYINDGLQKEIDQLLATPVSDGRAELALQQIIPANRGRREAVIHGIMEAFHDETLNPYQDNGLGLLNGVTDYFDHRIKRQSAASRLQEQLDGEGAQMRDKLVRELLHR